MNWKTKALIQKGISYLPSSLSEHFYFTLQYRFGNISPSSLYDTKKAFFFLDETNKTFGTTQKTFFEVGSGWTLFLPMALWLGGAKKIITMDKHRYVKPKLVKEYVDFWKSNLFALTEVFALYRSAEEFEQKFEQLFNVRDNINAVFELCNIQYIAPGDASEVSLADQSVDVHISTNVLEHIPGPIISNILTEAHRILKKGGLLLHRINPGDHFAHADPTISSINFLQYDQNTWDKWANNQFAYHNRFRANELISIFNNAGFDTKILEQVVDDKALKLLENGFEVHPDFSNCSFDDLATMGLILKAIKN